jgi:ectoine hydroxylase-related dioxygenase (phytanoyl-CoA dioxygenase family)
MVASELNQDIERFDDLGYLVVPEVLTRDEAEVLWHATEALEPVPHRDRLIRNERTLLRDRRFFDVVTNPRLVDAAQRLVGPDVQALDHVLLELTPGAGPDRSWHTDFAYVGAPLLVVTANVYLQDMDDESGPLYCLPGSHQERRLGTGEKISEPIDGELKLHFPAGTAVVFHSNLLHTGSRNRTNRPRRLLFHFYGHYWMKRLDDFYETPLPAYVRESDDPLVRQLFGVEQHSPSVHGASYNPQTYGG